MQFEVAAATDVGLRREINQDSILVDHDINLFIVADGMGGHRGGEVASALAVETVQDYCRSNIEALKTEPKKTLISAYREASARIHHKSTVDSPDLMGMGTTMVLCYGGEKAAYFANVGDSRAYLLKNSRLWQLTEDHSLINEQVKAGVITEDEAPNVLGRNVITRSVGFERDVQVDIVERVYQPGEFYLLCSDGLSSLVTNERIAELCRKAAGKEIVTRTIQEAKKAGGDDNVSVIVVKPKLD